MKKFHPPHRSTRLKKLSSCANEPRVRGHASFWHSVVRHPAALVEPTGDNVIDTLGELNESTPDAASALDPRATSWYPRTSFTLGGNRDQHKLMAHAVR
jgi:hypothetical protein